MHILIVEDDAAIRQELKQLLENALYQVTALDVFGDVAADIWKVQRRGDHGDINKSFF